MLKKIIKVFIPSGFYHRIKQKVMKRFELITVTRPYQIHIHQHGRFLDKIVVVTGGSGAIGRAISFRFASEGAIVYVCGRNEQKVTAIIREINDAGGKAMAGIVDINDAKSIEDFFDNLIRKEGRLDILVTNAGGSAREQHHPIAEQEPEIIDEVIHVNLTGTILSTKYAARQMIAQAQGKIVTISSAIGIQGKAGFSEYAAAKGGVIAYTRSLAMELGKHGINVNCVSPGIVERAPISYTRMEKIKTTNFMNSYGTPEDIAHMVAFVASDEATFITGQNFLVDGGRSLGLKGG